MSDTIRVVLFNIYIIYQLLHSHVSCETHMRHMRHIAVVPLSAEQAKNIGSTWRCFPFITFKHLFNSPFFSFDSHLVIQSWHLQLSTITITIRIQHTQSVSDYTHTYLYCCFCRYRIVLSSATVTRLVTNNIKILYIKEQHIILDTIWFPPIDHEIPQTVPVFLCTIMHTITMSR